MMSRLSDDFSGKNGLPLVGLRSLPMQVFVAIALAYLSPLSILLAADASTAKDAVQPILDRVAKMPLAEQQAWLRQLEQRAARATRLSLSPQDAARAQSRVYSLLHRKRITWAALREAIEETDRREREAVVWLASRYQSVAFVTFHEEREIYGRRQEAWAAVYRSWQAAGSPFERQSELLDWLELAIQRARPETLGAIPEGPKFGDLPTPKISETRTDESSRPSASASVKPRADVEKTAKKLMGPAKTTERVFAADSVQVNVEELAARIAGCNLGLRTFEADMDEKGPWDANQLTPMLDRLKVLILRRGDLGLIRDLLPEPERNGMLELEPARPAIAQFDSRLSEARAAVAGAEFKGTAAERSAELSRLTTLSRQLAELAGK